MVDRQRAPITPLVETDPSSGERRDGSGHWCALDPRVETESDHVRVSDSWIAHPLPDDEFWRRAEAAPGEEQIMFRATVPKEMQGEAWRWFVDGQVYRDARPPYETFWALEPGEHVVGLGRQAPEHRVRFTVH